MLRIAGKIAKAAKIRTRKNFVPHSTESEIGLCISGHQDSLYLLVFGLFVVLVVVVSMCGWVGGGKGGRVEWGTII